MPRKPHGKDEIRGNSITKTPVVRARVLRGKKVVIDTFGVPATPEIVHDLQNTRWGNQTIWDILVSAGVQMTENAGCSACLGGPVDTFGRMNTPMKLVVVGAAAVSITVFKKSSVKKSSLKTRILKKQN